VIFAVSASAGRKTWRGGAAGGPDGRRAPDRPGTRDPAERRLLNIVEEMDCAGVPRRPVHVMDEEKSINALSPRAGYDGCVVTVNARRARTTLSRDELPRA